MTASSEIQASAGACRERGIAGWTLREFTTVASTNLMAARLPPWHAVRADEQTHGRGRFQRSWVSDIGGLWLSAVVPFSDAPHFRLLPLAAGVAVCEALKELGLVGMRMRWPNDVLIESRKICGLLVDLFSPGSAVVGIGMNVTNHPERHDPALAGQVARVADFSPQPDLGRCTEVVLTSLRREMETLGEGGSAHLVQRINQLYCRSQVELDLDGRIERGAFTGVDAAGRLGLENAVGEQTFYDASQVRHLTEIRTES